MELTGTPFLALVVGITVGAFVAGAAWLPRTGRSPRGFLARLVMQFGVSVLSLLLVGVVLNNQNGWYANWGDLIGSSSPKVQQDQGGTSAAKALEAKPAGPGLPAPAAASLPPLPASGQRVQTFQFTGAHSGLSGRVVVSLPAGYQDPANAARTYPVIEAFHGFPGSPEVWIQGVNLVPSIDAMSAQGVMSDAIVVAPQIEFPPGTDTECVNGGKGTPQVETWLATDVPDQMASVLRVGRDRAWWAAIGFSSGGWCAAMAVMLHPDVFGMGIVLGGYTSPEFGKSYVPFPAGDAAGNRYDLVALAKSAPPAVALWLQTSKRDSLSYTGSSALLKAAHPPLSIESRVDLNAGHRMSVWADVVPQALTWLGATAPGFKAARGASPP
jgi:enterochelin esterase-like enzyme